MSLTSLKLAQIADRIVSLSVCRKVFLEERKISVSKLDIKGCRFQCRWVLSDYLLLDINVYSPSWFLGLQIWARIYTLDSLAVLAFEFGLYTISFLGCPSVRVKLMVVFSLHSYPNQ